MTKEQIIWTTIIVYIAIIAVIAFVESKKSRSISEFTVGKRNAGAWLSALSYGVTYFSAVMFVGYAGKTGWNYGLWGVLPGIGNAIIGSFLAWIVLAKKTREYTRANEIKSMPQFFKTFYGSEAMKLFSVVIIFVFLIPYSASVYKGLTSVCSVFLQVDERLCMIVIAITAALMIILGGYAATLKADFFQGIVMLGGVLILIISIIRCQQVGGFVQGIKAISEKTGELELGAVQHIGLWATVLMTSFGTWGLPQMIHKYYSIKENKDIKRGIIISTIFAFIVAGGGYFIGTLSRLFFTELTDKGTDALVPEMLNIAGLPDILLGAILVLLISASVSTLTAITITSSSTLTMDLIQPYIIKNKEKNITPLTRVICVLFILISFFIANSETPILDMMSYSWGIISGCFLAPYIFALHWKKANKAGAWASMICGFVFASPPLFAKLFGPGIKIGSFGALMDLGPHFACIAMAVSVPVFIIVSLLTDKKPVEA